VELVLTPEFNGEYYRIPPMPLGFLVIGALFLGFLLGYLIAWLTSLKR
jgi:phage shock protein PspC (stress-responsive transcriptional regulator)